MTKFLEISIIVLLVGFFITTYVFMSQDVNSRSMDISELNIALSDSIKLVNREDVISYLNSDSIGSWRQNYSSCDINFLEKEIKKIDFVENAEIYKDINGGLFINIVQKDVKIRIISQGGRDCYFSSDFNLLPTVDYYAADVMVVTCSDVLLTKLEEIKEINKKSEDYYNFIQNLFNFVEFIDNDHFWKEMIVQININEREEVELVPRVGSHSVVMCEIRDLSNYKNYISKLKGFYKNILPKKGWGEYSIVNLKYDDIVVASH